MAHTCSRCGGTNFHYNRARMRQECSSCGTPVGDMQQEQQLMQYDRSYAQAMNHLRAGNWDQTISLVRPFLSQYPTDKRIYEVMLRAATQDYHDLCMDNAGMRSTASEAWDKLSRLNGLKSEMLRYSRARYDKHVNELLRQRNAILILLFVMAAICVLFGVSVEQYWSLGVVTSIVCCFCCVRSLVKKHPIAVIRQLSATMPDFRANPFL